MLGGIKIIKTAGTHKEKSAGYNLQRLNLYKMLQSNWYLATDQILNYIEKLENMKNEILIDQEDLNLKQIAEENNLEYSDSDEQLVNNFIALFKKDNGIS